MRDLWQKLPPWAALAIFFIVARICSIVGHYTFLTPHKNKVVDDWSAYLPLHLVAEIGFLLCLIVLFRLCYHKVVPGKNWQIRSVSLLFLLSAGFLAVLGQVDGELKRWIGLRLNIIMLHKSFAATQDSDMMTRSIGYDVGPVCFAMCCVFIPIILSLIWWRKSIPTTPPNWRTTLALALLAFMGATVYLWWQPRTRYWKTVRPVVYEVSLSVYQRFWQKKDPKQQQAAIARLQKIIRISSQDKDYPLWRSNSKEKQNLEIFKKKSFSEKPDIILIMVESLCGWIADLRQPQTKELIPHIYRFWQERGVAFPRTHAHGYPSAEGIMNIHLGLWSHPNRVFLSEHVAMNTLSIAEILKHAGYHRVFLTGSDPSFDNLRPWLKKWYDAWEYSPKNRDDRSLALRFNQLYSSTPKNTPKFMTLQTISTHIPYTLPASEGPTPKDAQQAYLRALRYADHSLGIIFKHLRKSPRWSQTIVILVGDHAQPNSWHFKHQQAIGVPHIGNTWTTLVISAKDLAPGSLKKATASHVDLAPTILAMLNLNVSHHFMGRNLLSFLPSRHIYSMLFGGIGITLGDSNIRYQIHLENDTFVKKFRYDNFPGDYKLKEIKISPTKSKEFEKVRHMLSLYASLLDQNLICPKQR